MEEQREVRLQLRALAGAKMATAGGLTPTEGDLRRDLVADMQTCRKATVGPWVAVRESDELGSIGMPVVRLYDDEAVVVGQPMDFGPTRPVADDAEFIAAARAGWPAAIRRALAAERELALAKSTVVKNP